MFKVYFKQAIQMIRQNQFISLITILGTALAITMISTIIVVDRFRHADMGPENNRSRTQYVDRYMFVRNKTAVSITIIPLNILRERISKLKAPEVISIVSEGARPMAVTLDGSDDRIIADLRPTDAAYWKVMTHALTQGRTYSQEEFEAGVANAVISEHLARKLFKGEPAVGKTIRITAKPYRVIGVVKDVSRIFDTAYGEIWIPYTSRMTYESDRYRAILLVGDKKDLPAIDKEVRDEEQKLDLSTDNFIKYTIYGPDSHRVHMIGCFSNDFEYRARTIKGQTRKMIFIVVILILVPAINLSGFSMSRIKKRRAEIGVRKAFGAKKHIILIQVLYENMITSLLGGIIGVLLSYLTVYHFRSWLLGIPENGGIPMQELISLPVLFAVFLVCVVINLLSAGIPAYSASKTSIVNSLNQNDN